MAAGCLCSIFDCGNTASKRGWCNAHYIRWRRHGNPLSGRAFNLSGRRRDWLNRHALSFADRDQCLIVPFGLTSNRYSLTTLDDGDLIGSHRYVCEVANGPPPSPEHEVAHSCGNRPCVNRWHLRWATKKENAADRLLHGTDGRGEKNGHARLTRPEVDEIIRLRGVETGRSLATRFGVTPTQISNIQLRKQWSYAT